tara:strand:+ start:11078 stop:11242 length:165 start_codon:yes stop_codon:yes gene_type:complete
MNQIKNSIQEEIKEVVEDVVEDHCDRFRVSGEITWAMIECLAIAKQAQLQGKII